RWSRRSPPGSNERPVSGTTSPPRVADPGRRDNPPGEPSAGPPRPSPQARGHQVLDRSVGGRPMARRLLALPALVLAALAILAAPAFACGGLVAPGHAEVLQKATTLAAWHDGFEHYVTGFQFAGAAGRFGYIVPLPGVPSKIQKAGDWTLERLEREVNPPVPGGVFLAGLAAPSDRVAVLQRVRVDA